MSNFGESEKEKRTEKHRTTRCTAVTEETEGMWCSKGMMSLEFTGHVHVGEAVCRQCGIDFKTRASGIHKNARSQL